MTSIYIPPLPDGVLLNNITEPTNIDVLCGRDGYVQRHVGNQSYRKLVNANKEAYITCKKTDKLKISRCVVAAVREIGGRFLEKGKDGTWFDIGDKKAVEKTSQALREGQPKLKKIIVESLSAVTGGAESEASKTFEFKRTPEFEVGVTNTARISKGTPLDTIAASPVVDQRPTIDTCHDPFDDPLVGVYDVIQSPPMSPRPAEEGLDPRYLVAGQFSEGSNINSISEDVPYSMPDPNYQQNPQYNLVEQQYHQVEGQGYAVEPVPIVAPPTEITPAWPPDSFPEHPLSPNDLLHRQVTQPHANYSPRAHDFQPPRSYDQPPVDPLAEEQGSLQRQQYQQQMLQQQQQQQLQNQRDRDRFFPPARSRSSDSMMSSGSSIGPARVPIDWMTLSNTSNGSAIGPSGRKVDRRRMFAKMKATSSSTRMADGSRRSIDGMPDIHMVDSTFSLLSIGSNNNNRMGSFAAAGVAAMPTTSPSGQLLTASRDDIYVMPLIGGSRRSMGSSRRSFNNHMMSKDDTYAMTLGSRRSLMSGLSNVSGGAADSIFADMGRKIGAEVSTRSIAMSEISGIEEGFQPNLEEFADWEIKSGDEESTI